MRHTINTTASASIRNMNRIHSSARFENLPYFVAVRVRDLLSVLECQGCDYLRGWSIHPVTSDLRTALSFGNFYINLHVNADTGHITLIIESDDCPLVDRDVFITTIFIDAFANGHGRDARDAHASFLTNVQAYFSNRAN
tara:strand:+ start:3102 stop:3521 length:420 start_codon:yes stop_codon:yes gene_type:complete